MAAPSPEMTEALAGWFRALGDPARIRLMLALKHGELNVSSLVEATGIAQASVSKHLGVLRQAGILDVRREGPNAYYRIADQQLLEICSLVCGTVARRQQALSRGVQPRLFAIHERSPRKGTES